jgi:succinyl-CoA synthetase beta subunit
VKLLEYEAKELLKKASINVPSSTLVSADTPLSAISLPVVLKSQVPVGGRGKAGGIKVIDNEPDLQTTIDALFALPIKGHLPTTLLAEEKIDIAHEYYLSLVIDKQAATIQVVAHTNGGVDIETNSAEDGPLQISVSKGTFDAVGEQIAEYFDLPDQTFVLQDLIEKLYNCFVVNDATLIEINPLVYTADKKFIAGDCKMELDNNAAFRHDWQFEEKPAEANFVTLDEHGSIATIANGAGLAMATVDAVHDAGMTPANFLDIGGGANTETLLKAFRRLGEYPNIKAIVINIFAGITRCDEVARAIIAARQQIDGLPPLFIRLAGTSFDTAAELLAKEDMPILATLEECLEAAKQEVSS